MASSPADLARLERTTRNLEALYRGAGQAGTALASLAREMGAMTVQARAGAVGVREFTDALRGLQGQLRQGLASLAPAASREMAQAQQQARPSSFGTVVASAALASGLAATLGGSIPLELISAQSRAVDAEQVRRAARTRGDYRRPPAPSVRRAREGLNINEAGLAEMQAAKIGLGPQRAQQAIDEREQRPFSSLSDLMNRVPGLTEKKVREAVPEPTYTPTQQAGVDLAGQTKELQRQVEYAQARARLLGSPAGAAALKEQSRLAAERAATERRILDITGQAPRQSVSGPDWGRVSGSLGPAAAAASGAVYGVGGLGVPVQTQTLTRSVEELGMAVGHSLGPGLLQVAGYIQSITEGVDRLSPAFKSNAATIALWGAGLLGAGFAVSKLVAGVRVLYGVMSLGVAGPAGLGVAALTGLVATLGMAWSRSGDQARQAGRDMGEAGRANVGGGAGGAGAGPRRALPDELIDRLPPDVAGQVRGAGANQAGVLAALRAAQARAGADVEAARRREAEAAGASGAEQAASTARVELALPGARAALQAREAEAIREFNRMQARLGSPHTWDRAPEELRRQYARDEARRAIPLEAPMPRETAEQRQSRLAQMEGARDRLVRALMGQAWRDGAVGSQAQQLAQQGRERAEANQRVVNDLLGRLTGENGPALSIRNQLPASRSFGAMADYSEYLQGQALQPMGDLDTRIEIRRLQSITEALGIKLDKIIDHTRETASGVRGGW